MCRRLCCVFVFVLSLVWLLSMPALAAGDDEPLPPTEDLTAEELYTLVGIDPADDAAVEQYQVWLASLDCGAGYDDFSYVYLLAGYDPDGAAMSYALYCQLHEYEPVPATVTQNQYYTRYTGEDVALTYYKTADYGYPAGSWVLGTTGKNGTNGYFETRIVNLTQMQTDIQNAVTYSDLSPLTTILNTINTNILAGNKTMSDYLPGISSILNKVQVIQPDVAAIKNDLLSFTDYIATSQQPVLTYDAYNGSTTPVSPQGLMALLAAGFNAVAETDFNSENSRFRQFSEFFQDNSWDLIYSLHRLGRDNIEQIPIRGVGLYSLLGAFFQAHSEGLAQDFSGLFRAINGDRLSFSTRRYSYNPSTGAGFVTMVNTDGSLLSVLDNYLVELQKDVNALAFVFADLDARRLHAANKPMEGAVEDGFTGEGGGAATVDDVKDAAAISGSMKGLFDGNTASSADFFQVAGDDDNYDFFSQSTEAALDAVTYPPAAQVDLDVDAWLSDYVFDEQGFGSLRDTSYFSLTDALGDNDA